MNKGYVRIQLHLRTATLKPESYFISIINFLPALVSLNFWPSLWASGRGNWSLSQLMTVIGLLLFVITVPYFQLLSKFYGNILNRTDAFSQCTLWFTKIKFNNIRPTTLTGRGAFGPSRNAMNESSFFKHVHSCRNFYWNDFIGEKLI